MWPISVNLRRLQKRRQRQRWMPFPTIGHNRHEGAEEEQHTATQGYEAALVFITRPKYQVSTFQIDRTEAISVTGSAMLSS